MYNRHLSYRTLNPALNSNTFKNINKKDSLFLNDGMTIKGTVDKTALALCMLVISGYYSFSQENLILMAVGGFIGLFLFFTLIFKKSWAPVIVPVILKLFLISRLARAYFSYYFAKHYGC